MPEGRSLGATEGAPKNLFRPRDSGGMTKGGNKRGEKTAEYRKGGDTLRYQETASVALQCGRLVEGGRDELDEVAFFAKDETLGLREVKVGDGVGVLLETRFIFFVIGEAIEGDEPPADVVGAFVRKEIADEMAATARNDACPVGRIFLECIALVRIDLVADHTGDRHARAPAGRVAAVAADLQC